MPVRWTGRPTPRFVFVGTDQIPQNWLTIDYLVGVWARLAPEAELVLVGRARRAYPAVPNVARAGYVADRRDVYTAATVLLVPSFVRGGVKTKVLEAFAHGCPVLGNGATFEGVPLAKGYPLRVPLGELEAMVAAPGRHRAAFARAARIGRAMVARDFGATVFRERWAAACGALCTTALVVLAFASALLGRRHEPVVAWVFLLALGLLGASLVDLAPERRLGVDELELYG